MLEMGRKSRPDMYNLFFKAPPCPIPREHRLEVDERLAENDALEEVRRRARRGLQGSRAEISRRPPLAFANADRDRADQDRDHHTDRPEGRHDSGADDRAHADRGREKVGQIALHERPDPSRSAASERSSARRGRADLPHAPILATRFSRNVTPAPPAEGEDK